MAVYKLTYFNLRARAESSRLLLAHANVKYEDIRIEFADWPALKPTLPWGKMPMLQHGDVTLTQSMAILKYLAVKLGYTGANDVENAKCEEYCGAMADFNEVCSGYRQEKDPAVKEEKAKKMREEAFPLYLSKFEQILEENGKYLVGNKMTYADIYIANSFQGLCVHEPDCLDKYGAIRQHQDTIFNSPGIKEWVANRPVTQF